jgi:hypothetical protein
MGPSLYLKYFVIIYWKSLFYFGRFKLSYSWGICVMLFSRTLAYIFSLSLLRRIRALAFCSNVGLAFMFSFWVCPRVYPFLIRPISTKQMLYIKKNHYKLQLKDNLDLKHTSQDSFLSPFSKSFLLIHSYNELLKC